MAPTGAVPQPPREPSPRARALVFRFQVAQKIVLLAGLILAGAGALLCVPFCWGLPADLAISVAGLRQQAQVISTGLDRSVTVNGEHPTVIRFSYRVGGEPYTAESSTRDRGLIEAAGAPAALIPIEVSRSWPRLARVAGTTHAFLGWWGAASLLFPLLGGALVWFSVRGRQRNVRAFTHGTPALAKVTRAGLDPSTRINGRHPFKLEWEFEADGRSWSGSLSALDPAVLAGLPDERELVVLYDPADPKVNTAWVE